MTLARKHLIVAAILAGAALVDLPAVRDLIALSRHDMTASHLVFVPFVTLFLIWQERDRIFSAVRPATRAGAATIAAGALLLVSASAGGPAAHYGDVLSIRIAALIVVWLGAFLAVYGAAAFRRALFPLMFLLFAIPIPAALLDVVTQGLKHGSADLVAVLLRATGTTFYREGYIFAMATLTIEVADACSGIRSTIALLLTMLLAGHTFLDNRWHRLVLVLAMVPVTLLKNAVRIVGLSLLAMHVDPSFITGQLHHDGGIVFFVLGLAMLAPVLSLLRALEGRRRPRHPQPALPVQPA